MKFIKSNIRLIVAVVIAIILIITGVLFLNSNKTSPEKPNNPSVSEGTREEQIKEVTGMTKEDAINIVKENFGSDNYEFKAEATEDGLYKVVVTNTIEKTTITYFVDPNDGMFYIDM